MEVQRTTLSQSAAGALLAALARSDSSGGSFQQHFAETIDAVKPRRQNANRQEQPADEEVRSPKPKAERRSSSRAAEAERPEPAQTEDARVAAPETRPASPAAEVEPVADTEPAADPAKAVASTQEAPAGQEAPARQKAAATATTSSSAEPSTGDAARTLLKALGRVARVIVADGDAAELNRDGMAALAALGVKLQASNSTAAAAAGAAGDDGQAAREDTAVEFAVKQAQSGQSSKTQSDDSATLAAQRATVNRQSQTAQGSRGPAGLFTGDTDAESQARPAAAKGSLLAQARTAAQTAQAIPQVQAEVVAINLTSSTAASVLDGQDESAQSRITALPNTAKPAAAAGAAASERTSSVNQGEQIDRIARVMRASIGRGGSRVNLELQPKDIGPLRIQMNLRGNELTARFETQTETARQFLEQGLNQLREGLAQGGIRLVQATVENHGAQGENLDNPGGRQQDGSQGGQQDGSSSQQQHSQRQSGGQDRAGQGSETFAGRDALDVVA